jgi:hypothetical protein
MSAKGTKLPLPLVSLVLTVVLALFSAVGERAPQVASAGQVRRPAPAMEQHPSAVIYFKVLGWLSRIVPAEGARPSAVRPTPSTSELGHVQSLSARGGRAELCSLTLAGTRSSAASGVSRP